MTDIDLRSVLQDYEADRATYQDVAAAVACLEETPAGRDSDLLGEAHLLLAEYTSGHRPEAELKALLGLEARRFLLADPERPAPSRTGQSTPTATRVIGFAADLLAGPSDTRVVAVRV